MKEKELHISSNYTLTKIQLTPPHMSNSSFNWKEKKNLAKENSVLSQFPGSNFYNNNNVNNPSF